MVRRPFVRPAAAITAAALLLPAGAHAELILTPGGASPATVRFPGPARVDYRFTLEARGQDETFALRFEAPDFGRGAARGNAFGASIAPALPVIEGEAYVLGPARVSRGTIACSPRVAPHGHDLSSTAADVRVPAGTRSTVTIPARLAEMSPWPDTDYDLVVRAEPRLVAGTQGTLRSAQEAVISGPRPTGPRGVRLTLESSPPGAFAGTTPRRVRTGQTIRLSGTATPRQARVQVWVSTAQRRAFRLLRRVRADARGRFRTTVRAVPGLEVMVRTAARPPTFAADHSCALTYRVRR